MANNDAPSQAPQTQKGANPLKKPIVWVGIVGAIGFSIIAGRTWYTSHLFGQGEAAYRAGNCATALAKFTRVVDDGAPIDMNDWEARSLARKAECESYQSFAEVDPQLPATSLLQESSDFLDRYPASALVVPLQQVVEEQIGSMGGAELASLETCDRIPNLKTHQLIPEPDTQLPPMIQACGGLYNENQNFEQAIALYTQFIDNYPDHGQLNAVEVSLAETMVAQANAQNPGEIPPPPLSGYTSDGSTVVTIRNDSPESMRIVFSGTDPQFKELAPCKDCETFTGSAPTSCPEQGPEAKFVLAPGQYDVLVRSIGDRSVTPFTGTWALGQGSEYYSCFYIVQTPVGGS